MALEIAKNFTIQAPIAAVWSFLIDPVRVARCLPGAAITAKLDEKTYSGTMAVKVGPVQQSYKGKIVFEKLDVASHTAEIVGTGQDTKGKGAADLKLTSSLKETAPGTTEVSTLSLVNVSGILAQMGRGMISDVSDQMFKVFSERMRKELEAESEATTVAAAATAMAAREVASPLPTPLGTPAVSLADALASVQAAQAPAVTPAAAAAPSAAASVPAAASTAAAPAAAHSAAAPAPQAASAASPAPHLEAPPAPAAPAPTEAARFTPSPPAEVLDLGAVGSKAAVNVLLGTLKSPILWIGIALGIALDRWLFR
jgi:carbon monoxide dehydrogenase subunit G